jgi:hypothetical protein
MLAVKVANFCGKRSLLSETIEGGMRLEAQTVPKSVAKPEAGTQHWVLHETSSPSAALAAEAHRTRAIGALAVPVWLRG